MFTGVIVGVDHPRLQHHGDHQLNRGRSSSAQAANQSHGRPRQEHPVALVPSLQTMSGCALELADVRSASRPGPGRPLTMALRLRADTTTPAGGVVAGAVVPCGGGRPPRRQPAALVAAAVPGSLALAPFPPRSRPSPVLVLVVPAAPAGLCLQRRAGRPVGDRRHRLAARLILATALLGSWPCLAAPPLSAGPCCSMDRRTCGRMLDYEQRCRPIIRVACSVHADVDAPLPAVGQRRSASQERDAWLVGQVVGQGRRPWAWSEACVCFWARACGRVCLLASASCREQQQLVGVEAFAAGAVQTLAAVDELMPQGSLSRRSPCNVASSSTIML